MKQHTSINRAVLLDWIRHCDETGAPMPTDAAIMDRFHFTDQEQARTLLADLADRGLIALRYQNGERHISIGKVKPAVSDVRPREILRTVKKPRRRKKDIDVEDATARIMAIVKGGRTPKPRHELETVIRAEERKVPLSRPETRPLAPPSARPPQPPKERDMPATAKRQLNLALKLETFERIAAIAHARGVFPGRVAIEMLEERLATLDAMMSPPAEPAMVPLDGKPLVRAAVLRAATTAKVDLHQFCSMLIDLGLDAWLDCRPGDGA